MQFAGGAAQAGYVEKVRGLSPDRCLVVPVDLGKRSAVALVADHHGRLVGPPVQFPLTASGTQQFLSSVAAARDRVDAASVRIGIEAAGHYHRTLATTLHARGHDVVELNPRAVKVARSQLGQARVKTDVRDCMAMVELLVRGQGWPYHRHDDVLAVQALWVAHRRRKQQAAQALANQVHALADLALPGLVATFKTGLEAPTLRMLLSTIPTLEHLQAMTVEELVAHAAQHGRRLLRPKARQVIDAARESLQLPPAQQGVARAHLIREMAALATLRHEIDQCDQALLELIASTPAGVLTSIPGVGVVSASSYGAALGDPWRFANADAAYRYSGLAPSSYESAGRKDARVRISREGSVELRQAMIGLGFGMSLHQPDFVAYKRRLIAAGKTPMIAAVAVAHRAHRVAFAMVRSQRPFDEAQWTNSVAKGQPATTNPKVTAST